LREPLTPRRMPMAERPKHGRPTRVNKWQILEEDEIPPHLHLGVPQVTTVRLVSELDDNGDEIFVAEEIDPTFD